MSKPVSEETRYARALVSRDEPRLDLGPRPMESEETMLARLEAKQAAAWLSSANQAGYLPRVCGRGDGHATAKKAPY